MKWIKYQIVQSTIGEEVILVTKKIGHNEANLAIAEAEAYNGEYEIIEDSSSFEKEPLGIEFGGTGASTVEEAQKNLGLDEVIEEASSFNVVTVGSEPVTIEDNIEAPPFCLKIKGHTKRAKFQKYTGYNILQNKASTQTINGVTFTVNEDKTVTVNGTATADAEFVLSDSITVLEEGSHNIKCNGDTGSTVGSTTTHYMLFNGTKYSNVGVQTLSVDNVYSASIVVLSGVTVDNVIYKPVAYRGSKTLPKYEPYYGDLESLYVEVPDSYTGELPCIEYPQDIVGNGAIVSSWDSKEEAILITNDIDGKVVEVLIPLSNLGSFSSACLFDGEDVEIYVDGSGRYYKKRGVYTYNSNTYLSVSYDSSNSTFKVFCSGLSGESPCDILCSHFKNNGTTEAVEGNIWAIDNYYYVCTSVVTSADEFKTWLKSNGVKVEFPLKEVKECLLTKKQITEFRKLYLGSKNIMSCNGEVEIYYYKKNNSGSHDELLQNKGISVPTKSFIPWKSINGPQTGDKSYAIGYGNKRFVCVSNKYLYYLANDGTWVKTKGSFSDTGITDTILYAKDRFFYKASGTMCSNAISKDGKSWTSYSGFITNGKNQLIAVGNDLVVYVMANISTDDYTTLTGEVSVFTQPIEEFCNTANNMASFETVTMLSSFVPLGLIFGGDRFILVGEDGKSYYSIDGKTWTAMSGLNTSSDYYGVAYGNGVYVTVGSGGKVYYSTDGKTWTVATGPSSSYTYYGVAYGNGMFICVGQSGKSYYSTDGKTWSELTGLNSSYTFQDVTYGDGKFMCISLNGYVYCLEFLRETKNLEEVIADLYALL